MGNSFDFDNETDNRFDQMLTSVGRAFTALAVLALASSAFMKFHGSPDAMEGLVADPFFAPLIIGLLAWGGIFLRDSHFFKLIPIRGKRSEACERSRHRLE